MSEEFFKKYGNTIIGLIIVAIWGFTILAIMMSLLNKSIPNI